VPVRATIQVAAGFGAGRLYGWVDFNGDGDFDDADEQIADGEGEFAGLANGLATVSFAVPQSAMTGLTYARFRVGTEEGLGSAGPAADGEVEDYPVLILPPSPACNHADRYNVNGDADVGIGDIIDMIVDARANGFYDVSSAPPPGNPYGDVNGDYQFDIADILSVIFVLRAGASGEGEPAFTAPATIESMAADLSSGEPAFAISVPVAKAGDAASAEPAQFTSQLSGETFVGLLSAPNSGNASAHSTASAESFRAGAALPGADASLRALAWNNLVAGELDLARERSSSGDTGDAIDAFAADVAGKWPSAEPFADTSSFEEPWDAFAGRANSSPVDND
jgi:hypothetical protein